MFFAAQSGLVPARIYDSLDFFHQAASAVIKFFTVSQPVRRVFGR
jgi:hypothetical protein